MSKAVASYVTRELIVHQRWVYVYFDYLPEKQHYSKSDAVNKTPSFTLLRESQRVSVLL